MEKTTKKELSLKAREKMAPITEREHTAIKAAVENIAAITTLITIGAYVVMYAYKTGYYFEFNIPAICVRMSLRDYLPLLFQICSLSIYILWYIVTIKSDMALRRIKINGYRVLYGYLLVYMVLYSNRIFRFFPKYAPLPISFGLSFFVELLIYLIRKKKSSNKERERIVSTTEQAFVLQDIITDTFFYRYYIRTGFFVFALAVALMPFWGSLIARANVDFQICQLNDVPYAVIMDYGDSFIAQKAKIDDTCMEIDTSKYCFFQKEGVEFENRRFERISRVAAFSNEEGENAEVDLIPLEEG